jgi:hypothetical protein
MKVRRKAGPVVPAMQYTGSGDEVKAFAGNKAIWDGGLFIETPEGWMYLALNDWIVQTADGFLVCAGDTFPSLYEPVDEES